MDISEIFLVDHAWTTSPETARKELLENPNLLERLEGMMNIEADDEPELSEDEEEQVEHDDDTIKAVAEQANVSYQDAKAALEAEKYEVVNAITVSMYLMNASSWYSLFYLALDVG